MPEHPKLSVVMSIYNNSDQLEDTIDSISKQTFSDFELIIINDGSTDDSQQILEKIAARDCRIKLFRQSNQGLTKALIFGCKQATAAYIARHDAGDHSLANRFEKQFAYLYSHADCAAVFSHFNTVDELGHTICKHCPETNAIQSSINIDNNDISAPSHHGSAMFSKAYYLKAGGYRQEFHFTQDLDLWIRMSEHGRIHLLEEHLYDALIATSTISGRYHPLQKQYHDIIIESAKQRRNGQSDARTLAKAQTIRPTRSPLKLQKNESDTLYFMASCLLDENPSLAKYYLQQALKKNPAHLKAWYKLLLKT